jgi:hypothetical protein
MPIIKGTMGYTRFLVESPTPQDVVEKLNLFKFRPLHEKGEDNEALGWCPYLNEYDHERAIFAKDCLFDDKVVLSMRHDSITLPKGLLKMLVKKSLAAYERDHQKQADRHVKKELELFEAKALRSRILPKTKLIEAIWCQKNKELRVFSRSSMVDQFLDLFQQTFLVKPQRRDFIFEGMRESSIDSLTHQPIFMPPVRVDVQ